MSGRSNSDAVCIMCCCVACRAIRRCLFSILSRAVVVPVTMEQAFNCGGCNPSNTSLFSGTLEVSTRHEALVCGHWSHLSGACGFIRYDGWCLSGAQVRAGRCPGRETAGCSGHTSCRCLFEACSQHNPAGVILIIRDEGHVPSGKGLVIVCSFPNVMGREPRE